MRGQGTNKQTNKQEEDEQTTRNVAATPHASKRGGSCTITSSKTKGRCSKQELHKRNGQHLFCCPYCPHHLFCVSVNACQCLSMPVNACQSMPVSQCLSVNACQCPCVKCQSMPVYLTLPAHAFTSLCLRLAYTRGASQ